MILCFIGLVGKSDISRSLQEMPSTESLGILLLGIKSHKKIFPGWLYHTVAVLKYSVVV